MSDEKPPRDGDAIADIPPLPKPKLTLVGSTTTGPTIRARAQRGHPNIRHDHDLDLVVRESKQFLAKHPDIYQRNERLVDVLNGRIRELPLPTLRLRLTSCMTFMGLQKAGQGDKAKLVPRVPSDAVVQAIMVDGDWGARELKGVTDTPLVREDGSILQTKGYDVASRFLYAPSVEFPEVPESPTREECINALHTVLAPIGMFPWKLVDGRSPALSAYVSMLLTLVMVSAIKGNIPGFIISANVRGTGKSKLVQIASIIATGEETPTVPFNEKDDEVRKGIVGLLETGRRVIMFDNVTRDISGDSVDMLLTTRLYEDRRLGVSGMARYPNDSVYIWTGNNLKANGDTVRRVLPIDIECLDLNPELRVFDFDPIRATYDNRRAIVTALLTMVRGWYVAGCPRDTGVTLGSYEDWASIVPQILIWLGMTNPITAREKSMVVHDQALSDASRLAELWMEIEVATSAESGVTLAQVMRFICPDKGEPVHPRSIELRHAFEELTGKVGRDQLAQDIGRRLRIARKRTLNNGRSLDVDGITRGLNRWSVRNRAV